MKVGREKDSFDLNYPDYKCIHISYRFTGTNNTNIYHCYKLALSSISTSTNSSHTNISETAGTTIIYYKHFFFRSFLIAHTHTVYFFFLASFAISLSLCLHWVQSYQTYLSIRTQRDPWKSNITSIKYIDWNTHTCCKTRCCCCFFQYFC